jgi:DNA polymerase-3 subunit alpha
LKIHERKTSKGNSYAVLKLSDLTSVFELFIFSDLLELNREILKEGNSFILTIIKSVNEDNRFTRINVQKIASLKDLINRPIKEVIFNLKSLKELDEISKFLINKGETTVKINIDENDNDLSFELKNKRNLDRKTLNLLRNKEISTLIS